MRCMRRQAHPSASKRPGMCDVPGCCCENASGAPPFARIASWQPACNCKQARPALPLNTRGGICPNNKYSTADYMPHVVMKAHELVIAVFSYGSQSCRTHADGFSQRNGTQSFPRSTCGWTLFAVATKYAAAVYVLSQDAWSPNKSQQT